MCSYCGCDSIEVIGRFMSEHEQVINATGRMRTAVRSGDPHAVEDARSEVAALLWPHTEAEEAGLFRVMAREELYADHIATLCGEHASLEELLGLVVPGDDEAMRRFDDALRTHIDKEDNGLFPAAAVALDGAAWLEVHETTPHSHGGVVHVHASGDHALEGHTEHAHEGHPYAEHAGAA